MNTTAIESDLARLGQVLELLLQIDQPRLAEYLRSPDCKLLPEFRRACAATAAAGEKILDAMLGPAEASLPKIMETLPGGERVVLHDPDVDSAGPRMIIFAITNRFAAADQAVAAEIRTGVLHCGTALAVLSLVADALARQAMAVRDALIAHESEAAAKERGIYNGSRGPQL